MGGILRRVRHVHEVSHVTPDTILLQLTIDSHSSLMMLYHPYIQSARHGSPETRKFHAKMAIEKAVPALKFACRFMNDLAVNFNSFVDRHPAWLANLAPPATVTCCQTMEFVDLTEDVLRDERSQFVEIYKSLKVFNKRWKVGGELPNTRPRPP